MTRPNAKWVPVSAYCAEYSIDRRTLQKWAENGIVRIERVMLVGKRPVLRVQNQPPWHERVSIHG